MNYTKIMLASKVRKLAESICRYKANPYSVLLEASINIQGAPFNTVYTVLEDERSKSYADYISGVQGAWDKFKKNRDAEQQAKQPPVAQVAPDNQMPGDVKSLSAMLTKVVQELSVKHHMDDKQISALVDQALTQFKPFTANTGLPDQQFVHSTNTGSDGPMPEPEQAKAEPQQEEPVENPDFYGQMTNAERGWFDKLTPNQKRQFITRHNQTQGTGGNITKAGYANIDHNHPDFHKVQDIANQIKRRNPWMQDDAATFRAAAGLWNRQKIRQGLQKTLGDDGEDVPGYEDLLHKDHSEYVGKVIKDWNYLAGLGE